MPDEQFIRLFLSAMYQVDVSKIQKLYDFVMKSIGEFDIAKFKIRLKL